MNLTDLDLLPTRTECRSCPLYHSGHMQRLGVDMTDWDYIIALAGRPNTGKSTLFNAITGLHQHTGNWPGKTISRAEGGYSYANKRYKVVDLPGTYSLLAASVDEQIARDFILFGQPSVTVIVLDATRLHHNLGFALQVLEITDRAVVCLNLMDEAARHGLQVDHRRLARDLGVPVVPAAVRSGVGVPEALRAIHDVATGAVTCRPYRVHSEPPELKEALDTLTRKIEAAFPKLPNARWIALRLLDGDERIEQALCSGELAALATQSGGPLSARRTLQIDEQPQTE
jgi:Fe2+ transport system protein B